MSAVDGPAASDPSDDPADSGSPPPEDNGRYLEDMPCSSTRIEDCAIGRGCTRRNGLCGAMLSTMTSTTTTISSHLSCPRNCGSTERGGGTCQLVSGAVATVVCLSCNAGRLLHQGHCVLAVRCRTRAKKKNQPGGSERAASRPVLHVPWRLPRLPAHHDQLRLQSLPGRPLPSGWGVC